MAKKTNAMRLLDKHNVGYDIRTFEISDAHVEGAVVATKIGVSPDQVYKTLVLENADRDHFVCVIPVSAQLDLKSAAQQFHQKKLQLMPIDDLNRVTGYVRGGCSPLGMKTPLPTIIDCSALSQETIYISAGKRGVQMGVDSKTLISIGNARCAHIIK
ncbi:Cys-tRNA(Pro) deacylase [Staphylococcus hyicus]|uniref:Cys-tRNA(Pro) deacylase n=1 Tax=Staphylococcus hyicus TaxID=1284 RepID=UPI001430BD28|nr:Cys-tRNA(Pro) deacylase [Staphylococcus hyicus]NJH99499.1 Cys-tRNA(Pro) deacylase [Staphylococcus hyicus]NJI31003.1 Cys-tRNA(Pro) deacylase [Staphylococcus hyicus]